MGNAEPKFRRQPDRRPDDICDAAELVFVQNGFDQANLDAVAAEAGVTKGTIYLYFKSKEELYIRMMQRRAQRMVEKIASNVAGVGANDFNSVLDIVLKNFRDFMADPTYPGFLKLLISESGRFPELIHEFFSDVALKILGLVSGIYNHDMAEGRLKKFDPKAVMLSLIGMHLSYVITQDIFQVGDILPVERKEYEKVVESIFRDGIRSGAK